MILLIACTGCNDHHDGMGPGEGMHQEEMQEHHEDIDGEHHESEMGEHHDEETDEHHGEMQEYDGERLELSGNVVDGVREINVEAFQFGFKPSPIVVKKDQKVKIKAKSADVTHGFGIDDLGINQTLPPGEEKIIEFTPDKAGEYHVHCTVYCGSGHENMHTTLIVKE